MTAALTQHAPVPHIEPRDEREETRRSANIGERWVNAAQSTLDDQLDEDLVYSAMRALVRDSESVLKVVHRPDAWASFPRRAAQETATSYEGRATDFKRTSALPFAMRNVDRLQMLWGSGEYGDEWAIEYGAYPLRYLGARYRMALDTAEGRLRNPGQVLGGPPKPENRLTTSQGMAIKLEYFDAEWWHVVVDGENAPGWPKPNPYAPFMPYFRAKLADPILFALRWLVPALDALLTMKLNWSHLGGYPIPMLRPVPGTIGGLDVPLGDEPEHAPFVWKPGKMLEVPAGYEFLFSTPPPVGRDIDELIGIMRNLVDVAGVPSVFRGVGGADQPGYAINQLIAAANLTYKILGRLGERQLSKAWTFVWHMISRVVRQTVYALDESQLDEEDKPRREWLGLSPGGGNPTHSTAPIDHFAKLSWTFRPVLPTDEQARAMVALQLTNAARPLYSKQRALEKWLQEEDPQSVLDEIATEQAMDTEPIRSIVIQEALRQAHLPMPAGQAPAAGSGLLGPDGQPIGPSAPPGIPGQAAGGLPSVPGLTMPLAPGAPAPPPIRPGGGRAAGAYPGRPGVPRSRVEV